MDFSSVDDFLKKASSVKKEERQIINDQLDPFLSDPCTVGITPSLSAHISELKDKYGDEALKQIGIFCLGKWLETHEDILQQHAIMGAMDEALLTMNDISLIAHCVATLEGIGSFEGDEDWRKMLKEIVGQSVLEKLEEDGIDPASFFSRRK